MIIMKKSCPAFSLALLITLVLTACSNPPAPVIPTATSITAVSSPTLLPTSGAALTPQAPTPPGPTPTAATAAEQKNIWFSPAVPVEVSKQLLESTGMQLSKDKSSGTCVVDEGKQNLVGEWVYALAAPFNTVADDIDQKSFLAKWKDHTADFPAKVLLVDQGSKDLLTSAFGDPDPDSIQVITQDQLLGTSWKNPNSWAVVPFDQIQPEWKVISISNVSPIHKQFDPAGYLLTIPLSINCNNQPDLVAKVTARQISNRDPNALTTVILTGVTAMVRGTAYLMETKGITYPDTDIRDILREADFTHISNEVPYWPKCPPPFTNAGEAKLVFCSNPKYNQLLEDVGADIIELSGDHFNDWGPDATNYTIDLYKSLGWKYYGGGYNLEDGRKPLLIEHNGNKIAFLGCNAKPPGYGTASATEPGAVHCNFTDMDARIKEVKAQGYIPIVTFQHLEYYSYTISPFLQKDFRNVADAGAAIVSGSQGHQPQGIEFYNGSFLHYGLGNLFFDQYKEGFPTRQAFIDRYVFYKGKYISTELITIMFTDLAHSRLMNPGERQDLLQTIFKVSLWPFSTDQSITSPN